MVTLMCNLTLVLLTLITVNPLNDPLNVGLAKGNAIAGILPVGHPVAGSLLQIREKLGTRSKAPTWRIMELSS